MDRNLNPREPAKKAVQKQANVRELVQVGTRKCEAHENDQNNQYANFQSKKPTLLDPVPETPEPAPIHQETGVPSAKNKKTKLHTGLKGFHGRVEASERDAHDLTKAKENDSGDGMADDACSEEWTLVNGVDADDLAAENQHCPEKITIVDGEGFEEGFLLMGDDVKQAISVEEEGSKKTEVGEKSHLSGELMIEKKDSEEAVVLAENPFEGELATVEHGNRCT